MSRLFAIGDVHGYLKPLETLIDNIKPQTEDTLIFLGDLIDRGDDSKGVIDLVMALSSQCTVQCIQGNHEEMMLKANEDSISFQLWLMHGGRETLRSFGVSLDRLGLAEIPANYLEFMNSMLPYVETQQHIFSHATPEMYIPIAQQSDDVLRWNALSIDRDNRHCSGKTIVCGHTSQDSGLPWVEKGLIAIDTYICGDEWLTALDMGSLMAHQANQSGDYRCLQQLVW